MKKLIACLLAGVCTAAVAGLEFKNIPENLQKPLQGNALTQAQMDEQGVLRLHMGKPVISELEYTNFIFQGLCAEQWRNPQRFASWAITKVELLNEQGQQGYAFDARGDVCEELGHSGQAGQNYRKKITERTVTCQQGRCGQ